MKEEIQKNPKKQVQKEDAEMDTSEAQPKSKNVMGSIDTQKEMEDEDLDDKSQDSENQEEEVFLTEEELAEKQAKEQRILEEKKESYVKIQLYNQKL